MPEGDTIHRTAKSLRAVLAGRPLVRLDVPRSRGRQPAPGTLVDSVEAVGKHLLIRFADHTTLRTHMRMTGSWHIYRSSEPWRRPRHLARATIEVEGWVAVCFAAPVVELENDVESATGVARLGPDLTVANADIATAAERMTGPQQVGVALLDQRVAAGLGNIFKSESLYAARVNPFESVDSLDHRRKVALLTAASKLLQSSVATSRSGHAVYGRAGQPCHRCGTPIRAERQGEPARTTYWCPSCQK